MTCVHVSAEHITEFLVTRCTTANNEKLILSFENLLYFRKQNSPHKTKFAVVFDATFKAACAVSMNATDADPRILA